jgi:hypothetical protein
MGRCLLWVVFFKITEVAQIYIHTTFSRCISYIFTFQKTAWATFWATFFPITSGHPAPEIPFCSWSVICAEPRQD